MKLTIGLIVHDDFSHIGPALQSPYATTKTPCEVYVTINSGDDVRVDALRAEFPATRFLINAVPVGFAANHNQIMRQANTEYIALLNDDVLPHERALDTLVEYLEHTPEAGLCGPSLAYPDGKRQVAVYSDPTLLRMLYKISGLARLTHQQIAARRWLQKTGITRLFKVESLVIQDTVRSVPIIKGVAMVVRRRAIQDAGLMDEVTRAPMARKRIGTCA